MRWYWYGLPLLLVDVIDRDYIFYLTLFTADMATFASSIRLHSFLCAIGGDHILLAMAEQPPEQTTTWDMTLDDGPVPVPWSTVPLRDSRYRGDHPSWPALHKVTVVPPPPWRTFVEIYIDFGASVRFVLSATQIPDDCQAWGSTFEDPWGGRWLEPDEVLAADVDCVQCWHC